MPKKGKIPKNGLERMQQVFWTASKKPFALVHIAPVQKRVWVVQKTLRRPLLPGSKIPVAPSPDHFWA